MRCDRCGARNADGATWCTQCYAAFSPAPPSVDAGPSDAPLGTPELDGSPPTPAGTSASTPASTAVEVGDVRDLDGVVEWRCRTCESWVALEMPSCHACGSPRAGFGEEPRPQATVPTSDHGKVLTAAALFPGVGHLLAGRTGSGVTRLALGLLWLIGGIWWVATTAASGSPPGLVLLLGTLVLWIASYLDIQAILAGKDEPFGVRGLLWTVVGVTALLMVAVAWLATGPSLA